MSLKAADKRFNRSRTTTRNFHAVSTSLYHFYTNFPRIYSGMLPTTLSLPHATILFMFGIAVGRYWSWPVIGGRLLRLLLVLIGLTLITAWIHSIRMRSDFQRNRRLIVLQRQFTTFLLAFFIVATGWSVMHTPWGSGPVPEPTESTVDLIGYVVRQARQTPYGWEYTLVPETVKPLEPESSHAVTAWQGRIAVHIRVGEGEKPPFRPGDRLSLRTTLRTPRPALNPGDLDYRWYLAAQGILWEATARSEDIELLQPRHGWRTVPVALMYMQQKMIDVMEQTLLSENAGLMKGLLFGYKDALEADMTEQMRQLGLMHVLAVSGLHVGLLAGVIYCLTSFLRVSVGTRATFIVLWMLSYTVLADGRPSVWRASVMAIAVLAAQWLGRPSGNGQRLAVAMLLLLLWRPALLFDLGLQMSFLAYAGLVYGTPPLQAGMATTRGLRLLPAPVRTAIAASMAAQLAVLPLMATHFGSYPIWSPLANLIILPFVGVAVAAGLAASMLGIIWLPGGWFFNRITEGALSAIRACAYALHHLPYPLYDLAAPSFSVTAAYYAFLLLGRWLGDYGRLLPADACERWRSMRPFVVASLVLMLFAGPLHQVTSTWPGPGRVLTVEFLAVGQGDGMIIRLPRGGIIVIDGGPLPHGGREPALYRQLRRRGIRNIDVIVVTHAHADHYAGLLPIVQNMNVAEVWQSGFHTDDLLYLQWQQTLIEQDVTVYEPKRGDVQTRDGVRIEVLNPPDHLFHGTRDDANNNSLVLRMTYGNSTMLFAGDIDRAAEESLLRENMPLGASVLKVAHHGSKYASADEFLQRVSPRVAIIQTGPNSYGLPSPETIDRLERHGIDVWRTDEQGAILYRTDGHTSWLRSWVDGNSKIMNWQQEGERDREPSQLEQGAA